MKKLMLLMLTLTLMIGGCTYAPAYRTNRYGGNGYGRHYDRRPPGPRPYNRPSRPYNDRYGRY